MPSDLSSAPRTPARERILDAATTVIRENGIARATTKAIAREAGYSEALLYKHFADKQEIYLAVLRERVSGYMNPIELVGTATVAENLAIATEQLMRFYVQTFPMSASIFSSHELLTAWRDGMAARGAGPNGPILNLQHYLEAEQAAGRLPSGDPAAIAALLCGAAFQQAFLACFHGESGVPKAQQLAAELVASLFP